MSDLHKKDFELMKSYWRLVPHSKRDYWDASTLEWVRGLIRPHLSERRYSDEIVEQLFEARNAVSAELGIPPWRV